MRLELVTLVVRDYEEALAYYTEVLGFVLVEDTSGINGWASRVLPVHRPPRRRPRPPAGGRRALP
jgi:catechol 2,3-dioxygenase-like lactoylglutathione lyase family enzyme